ncbi:obscurin-like isoform X2 [Chaetodon auriga]|uniref:obscurin-like isoform X2 n=1 Tax=Chaetodon auriga TaxID=39042 RepID=UPI004032B37A
MLICIFFSPAVCSKCCSYPLKLSRAAERLLDVRMGRTLLCVLGFSLLNTFIRCEHATDKIKPNLTVSPSWLSPGDSVTLTCSVKDPSAGWRFFWYRAATKRSSSSRSYELLPGSSDGTEQDSFIVRGQTGTAGYKCRARGGDPVNYTDYSQPKIVWSGDSRSASVKVNPDRAQLFFLESVSLTCEGNSDDWTVRRYSEAGHLSNCSTWGTMKGSTCSVHTHKNKTTVYWCETGSGQFSNAVNITVQRSDIILVSPVRPVTEGDSVTLSCQPRTGALVSNVSFYRNGDLVQNNSRAELKISAASKSDEGFYMCEHSGRESPQSWVAVKLSRLESSPFPLPLIIGLICGVLLILVLLLSCCCVKKKDPFDSSTQRTNQGSALDQGKTHSQTQPEAHSSHLHDADESSDITYSLLQLKNIRNTGQHFSPEESTVYSNLKKGSAAGKLSSAGTDETVYSEVNLALGP